MVKIVNGKVVGMDESVDTHIGRMALKNFELFKSRVNQIDLIDGSSETFGSVRLRSIRVAQELETRNLKIGDTILICGVNHMDLTLPAFAALYKGYKIISLVTTFSEMEYTHFLGLSEPKIIFCDRGVAETLEKICKSLKIEAEIVVFGNSSETSTGFTNFSTFLRPTGKENTFQAEDFDPKETLAFLVCSSGSTGLPKCVCLSHHNMISAIFLSSVEIKMRLKILDSNESSCSLSFSPLYWISGIMSMTWPILSGYTRLQSTQPFSVELFAKALKNYKPVSVLTASTTANEICTSSLCDEIDFSCLRILTIGGMVVPESLYFKMKEKVQNGLVINSYGLTETAGIATCDAEHRTNSVGRFFSFFEWKFIDTVSGEEIKSPGVNGELCVKSETVFKGYYKNPEATAQSFTKDNFFRTGDIGYFDEDGFIYIVDRLKEVIKYKAYQVTTFEIESLIISLEGVLYCCAIGLPHPMDGEQPTAVVQLLENSKVTEEDIHKIINDNLSDSRKLRGGVVFLKQMPLTKTGKLDRKRVKEIVFEMKNVKPLA